MPRWTDIAQWVGPTVNEGDGDGRPGEPADRMGIPMGLVLHIAEGFYAGTIVWQRNPVAEVSSHFVVARDGRIAQMVDTDDRSWCQSAGNASWISVENEGYHTDSPTAAQVEALAQLYARCMAVYGMPARATDSVTVGGLGWHGMGGAAWGGHYQCPGEGFKRARPAILARAVEINGGDDMTPAQAQQLDDVTWVIDAMFNMRADIANGRWKDQPSPIVLAIQDLQKQLDDIKASLAESGPGGPSAADIAKAVNDDAAARLAE